MRELLITIAAVVLTGCIGVSKTELLKDEDENPIILPAELAVATATPEPPRASIHRSARQGEIGFIIQHIDAGSDVLINGESFETYFPKPTPNTFILL